MPSVGAAQGHAALSTDTARRRRSPDSGYRCSCQSVWTLRVSPDYGAAGACRLEGEKFSRLEEMGRRDGISIVTEIVEGDPEEMIESRAEAEDVDLIVIGHRDVTRLRHWLERVHIRKPGQ